jgi:hypothetical protein
MDAGDGRTRLRTFLLGGIVGAFAVIAALLRRRPAEAPAASRGLAAFEEAPCYRETLDAEARSRQSG